MVIVLGVRREIETTEDKLKKLEYFINRAYRKIEQKHSEIEPLRSETILLHSGP